MSEEQAAAAAAEDQNNTDSPAGEQKADTPAAPQDLKDVYPKSDELSGEDPEGQLKGEDQKDEEPESKEEPGEDQKDEDGDQDKGQVPDSPEGYELHLPENFQEVPEISDAARKFAHEQNFTQEQFDAMVAMHSEAQGNAIKRLQADQPKQIEAWKAAQVQEVSEAWGKDFQTKLEHTHAVYERHVSPELRAKAADAGLDNSALFTQIFAELASHFKEDTTRVSGKGASPDTSLRQIYTKSAELND
jgi:hypothetical protein